MVEPVVSAKNLGKTYWLYPSIFRRVVGCFMAPARTGATPLRALSGLTFDVYPGEALALIGKNGAGKSTALQLLAGILKPSEGEYLVRGRMCALLELGSGFNPEFTGRENIAIAGTLAGLTREEIRAQEKFIIEFADIGRYIDQPVKFYSSGMFLRLAFAVAIAGEPDVLIVDEALAVGDIFFRQKCYARLKEMRKRGMAVLLVTHSSGDAREFCDRAVLLERGRQTYLGDPKEALMRYYIGEEQESGISESREEPKELSGDMEEHADGAPAGAGDSVHGYVAEHPWPHLQEHFTPATVDAGPASRGAALVSFCLTDEEDSPTRVFAQGTKMRVYAEYRVDVPVPLLGTGVSIWDETGVAVYSTGSFMMDIAPPSVAHPPATVYACQEISLNIACREYILGFGVAAIAQEVFDQREYCGYEEWESGIKRLLNIDSVAAIQVMLPHSRYPSRVVNYGLIDLPSQMKLFVRS